MEYKDRNFAEDEKIEMDGSQFVNCKIDGATLIFRGKELFTFENVSLTNPKFIFEDDALTTLRMLKSWNAMDGGETMIQEIFDDIISSKNIIASLLDTVPEQEIVLELEPIEQERIVDLS